jgi:hypothetical protein
VDQLAPLLNWQLPAEDPRQLADAWAHELDRHGVAKASLIASVPGRRRVRDRGGSPASRAILRIHDGEPDGAGGQVGAQVEAALASGHIHALCFFPAMHRYSIQDDRVTALLELLAARPRTPGSPSFTAAC